MFTVANVQASFFLLTSFPILQRACFFKEKKTNFHFQIQMHLYCYKPQSIQIGREDLQVKIITWDLSVFFGAFISYLSLLLKRYKYIHMYLC